MKTDVGDWKAIKTLKTVECILKVDLEAYLALE
jgi:hypothetical protein